MTASQDQIIIENENVDGKAVVDIDNLLSSDRAIRKPEPLVHAAVDNDDYTKQDPKPKISERTYYKRRTFDNSEKHGQLMAEYSDANSNRRMQMYLQFPLLTSEFGLINRNDPHIKSSADFKLRVKSFASQMGTTHGPWSFFSAMLHG
jgi:hypothetical protein